jgi:hypothetical protein
MPEAARGACLRLRFANRDAARVEEAVAAMREPVPAAADGSALRRWVARHRGAWEDAAAAVPDVGERDAVVSRVTAVLTSGAPLTLRELAVRGEDLRAAGVAEGPAMGRVLRQLLEATLDDPTLNTKEMLLARARELA